MQNLWSCCRRLHDRVSREAGQDLIEYAMVIALIAFAVTAGMQTAAMGVSTVFTTIGGILTSATGL
jgi:pilus assembly protein Flp/PilA